MQIISDLPSEYQKIEAQLALSWEFLILTARAF